MTIRKTPQSQKISQNLKKMKKEYWTKEIYIISAIYEPKIFIAHVIKVLKECSTDDCTSNNKLV